MRGAGAPILVLHGASGAAWLPFMQALSEKFDVIAPEHARAGDSSIRALLHPRDQVLLATAIEPA